MTRWCFVCVHVFRPFLSCILHRSMVCRVVHSFYNEIMHVPYHLVLVHTVLIGPTMRSERNNASLHLWTIDCKT